MATANESFAGKLVRAITSNAVTSALNLLTTIFVARWYGDHVYANYVVDLAIISIILIFLEIIPANFIVFKVQDEPVWINVAAAQAVVSFFFIAAFTVGLGKIFHIFKAYSSWIAAYAAAMAIKRYLDIRMQSSGKIAEFLRLEFIMAALRLGILFCCVLFSVEPVTSVWMSLAVATFVSQFWWFIKNNEDYLLFKKCFLIDVSGLLWKDRDLYFGYYLGIGLKRIKDNMMPVVAERFFQNKNELAAFFLAYRGIVFAVGQVRVLEAMINHKSTMNFMVNMSGSKVYLVAFLAQLISIVASTCITYLAGAEYKNIMVVVVLSIIALPATSIIITRAKAYSEYKTRSVNVSLFANIFTMACLSVVIYHIHYSTISNFAWIVVISEISGSMVLLFCMRSPQWRKK